METTEPKAPILLNAPNFNQEKGAEFWYGEYIKQLKENQKLVERLSGLEGEVEQLKEGLQKLSNRNSDNSSQPPSSDGYKKKSKAIKKRTFGFSNAQVK